MNVKKFLKQQNTWFETIGHDPTYDANSLAMAVHVMDQEVAKSVMLHVDDGFVLVVVPASCDVDLWQIRKVLGAERAVLASESDCAHEFLDCEFGARLPFGSQYGLRTVMDESLKLDNEIVFEGNTHDEAIRMKLDDFIEIEKPFIADVAMPRSFGE